MKSTISVVHLICTECSTVFDLSRGDYLRRLKKLPNSHNFFCSRKCGGRWRSKHVIRPANTQPTFLRDYRKQHNITNNKYDIDYIWYANRIAMDVRRHVKATGTRDDIIIMLRAAWDKQQGLCAITQIPLHRRVTCHGTCDTTDPFRVASVDRKDSTLPYAADNVQWVSLGINLAKGDNDDAVFRKYFNNLISQL